MARHDVPADVRKRLAARLKQLRGKRLQPDTVERLKALDTGTSWSVSKLSKIENNTGRVQPDEIEELFTVYEHDDPEELEKLKRWARAARQKGVWTQRRPGLPDNLNEFATAEQRANKQRIWEPLLIPAQCQTRGVAEVLIGAMEPDLDQSEVDQRVDARMARQRVGTQELIVVLDEDVLRREVKPVAVWIEQLQHLISLTKKRLLTLRVVPRSAGPHPGHAGWFALLSFPNPDDQDRGYTDGQGGSLYLEDADQVAACTLLFDKLFRMALSEEATIKLIQDIIDRLTQELA